MRDDEINFLIFKIAILLILTYVLYTQAGTTGTTIMLFTVMMVQTLNLKPN
jgi:hypothetical protein